MTSASGKVKNFQLNDLSTSNLSMKKQNAEEINYKISR
jgi:hypothetical protein